MQEISVKFDYEEILPEIRRIVREELLAASPLKKIVEEEAPRVTTDELLKEIKISKATFSRLRQKYVIPCEYVGRRLLFQISKVLQALQAPVYLRRN